jgi:hypothetical protein
MPNNLIFTTKFNDSSILIMIISCDFFTLLERSGELAPSKVDVLQKLLKMLDRADLVSKVEQYQGMNYVV